MKYIMLWAAEQPMIKQYCQMIRYNNYRHVLGNIVENAIIWSTNSYIESYFSEESIELMLKEGEKYFDKNISEEIIKETQNAVDEWWDKANIIRTGCLNQYPDLMAYANVFSDIILKVFAYFITSTELITHKIEERIREILAETYMNSDLGEKLITITTPTEKDLIYKEKESWLSVIENPNKINEHMLKFPLLFCNMESKKEALKLMHDRLKESNKTQLKEELETINKKLESVKETQKSIFMETKSEELKRLATLLQRLSILRLEIKACWSGMHFYLLPFFNKLTEISNVNLRDVMMFYTTEEIIDLAEKKQALSDKEIAARRKGYILIYDKGKLMFYSGNKALRAKAKMLDPFVQKPELSYIKGTVANRGKVTGIVKLVKTDDLRELTKIANGLASDTILVTGMTNPNMMVLVQKVSGIVTDEGGIACHAAIVSREFGIPCIVGCRFATKVLNDGDKVELDAYNGIVQKID